MGTSYKGYLGGTQTSTNSITVKSKTNNGRNNSRHLDVLQWNVPMNIAQEYKLNGK